MIFFLNFEAILRHYTIPHCPLSRWNDWKSLTSYFWSKWPGSLTGSFPPERLCSHRIWVLFLKKKISLEEPLDLLSPPTPPLALTPAQLINLEESLEYFKLAWHAGWRQYGQQAPDGNLDFKIGISAIFLKNCMQTLTKKNVILCVLVFSI